jgi:hypothetical protein
LRTKRGKDKTKEGKTEQQRLKGACGSRSTVFGSPQKQHVVCKADNPDPTGSSSNMKGQQHTEAKINEFSGLTPP